MYLGAGVTLWDGVGVALEDNELAWPGGYCATRVSCDAGL